MSILRLPAVKARTGKSRSSIYLAIAKGEFPSPVKIGVRAVGWRESDVDSWIERCPEARISATTNQQAA